MTPRVYIRFLHVLVAVLLCVLLIKLPPNKVCDWETVHTERGSVEYSRLLGDEWRDVVVKIQRCKKHGEKRALLCDMDGNERVVDVAFFE